MTHNVGMLLPAKYLKHTFQPTFSLIVCIGDGSFRQTNSAASQYRNGKFSLKVSEIFANWCILRLIF